MTVEPFLYRARKWTIQNLTGFNQSYDQHNRLKRVDWDVLIVLDACRYDMLQRLVSWPIRHCQSPASATPGWLHACQETGILEDKYIATANSQYEKFDVNATEVHMVWEENWVPRLGTVPPEPVLETAIELTSDGNHPVVAHVLPPHAPYIARVGGTWVPVGPDTDIWKRNPDINDETDKLSPQVAMARGKIDMSDAIDGYRASVASTWAVVTEYIGRWIEDGNTVVVTADHGECFGRLRDWGFYEHPVKCYISPLTTVPFVKFTPGEVPSEVPETVDETLEALGYV